MSAPDNARLIPEVVKAFASILSLIAVIVGGIAYFVSREVGHFVWLGIGLFLAVIAAYLSYLRMK